MFGALPSVIRWQGLEWLGRPTPNPFQLGSQFILGRRSKAWSTRQDGEGNRLGLARKRIEESEKIGFLLLRESQRTDQL